MDIAKLRKEMGLTQEEFGPLIGLKGKSSVSELENTQRASVDVALKIEALSVLDGVARIDAAALNDDVAKAREACTGICHQENMSHHAPENKAAHRAAATGKSGNDSRDGVAQPAGIAA